MITYTIRLLLKQNYVISVLSILLLVDQPILKSLVKSFVLHLLHVLQGDNIPKGN